MPSRPSWKASLRLSLVTVPVQAFKAAEAGVEAVRLNQLHEECHSRIHHKKVCPIHGEVANDEIVSGYEFAKDQYVIVDKEEMDAFRGEADKAISLDAFISPDEIDPIYFDGTTYYLLPDGKAAERPYAVLRQSMDESGQFGVGEAVFSGREHLVLLRPMGKLLTLMTLNYADEVRSADEFERSLGDSEVKKQEVSLAKTLLAASTPKKFDLAKYHDDYAARLKEMIQAKAEGKEIVAAPTSEEPQVINLMDALKASVSAAKKSRGGGRSTAAPIALRPSRRKVPRQVQRRGAKARKVS